MIEYVEKLKENELESIVNYTLYAPTVCERNYVDGKPTVNYILKVGCGFDIETTRIELPDYTTGYCYHWQFSMDNVTIGGRNLKTMQYFFGLLISILKSMEKQPKLLVFDANLGYEFQYCKHYWYELGMSGLFTKEKRNPLKIEIGNQIIMRECLGLFGRSLSQIAKTYHTVPKLIGDLDYNKVILSNSPMTQKEMDYCENDVQILSGLGKYVFEHFFGKNPKLPMTSTGIIRSKIKKKLGKNLKAEKEKIQSWLPNEFDYNNFRRYLFKGGICGTNALYANTVLEGVVCADYTSDYPACMNHYDFPMGKCTVCDNREFMSEKNVPYIALIEFRNVKARTTHSLMSTHKCVDCHEFNDSNSTIDNGRVYEADKMTLYLNDVEFRSFIKAYRVRPKETFILKCWKFERYGALPSHVMSVLNEEYLKKEELKSKGLDKTIEYADSKAVVNGIFGMMCTSIFTDDFVFEGCEIDEKRNEDGFVIKKSFEEATKGMFLYPFWGYWITSYARSLLIDIIIKFPELIVQYDTDSIYYISTHSRAKELEEYINSYNESIYKRNDILFNGNKHYMDLGAWDISKPYKRFKGLGSKRYIKESQDGNIECVVSGCRKVMVDENYNKVYKDGRTISTIEYQLAHNNKVRGENVDIFDFFDEGMIIDEEHSEKLTSEYVEQECVVDYTDFQGNVERIECSSSLVLSPASYTMGLSKYTDFYRTIQGLYNNSPGTELRKIWKELNT